MLDTLWERFGDERQREEGIRHRLHNLVQNEVQRVFVSKAVHLSLSLGLGAGGRSAVGDEELTEARARSWLATLQRGVEVLGSVLARFGPSQPARPTFESRTSGAEGLDSLGKYRGNVIVLREIESLARVTREIVPSELRTTRVREVSKTTPKRELQCWEHPPASILSLLRDRWFFVEITTEKTVRAAFKLIAFRNAKMLTMFVTLQVIEVETHARPIPIGSAPVNTMTAVEDHFQTFLCRYPSGGHSPGHRGRGDGVRSACEAIDCRIWFVC